MENGRRMRRIKDTVPGGLLCVTVSQTCMVSLGSRRVPDMFLSLFSSSSSSFWLVLFLFCLFFSCSIDVPSRCCYTEPLNSLKTSESGRSRPRRPEPLPSVLVSQGSFILYGLYFLCHDFLFPVSVTTVTRMASARAMQPNGIDTLHALHSRLLHLFPLQLSTSLLFRLFLYEV